MDVEQAAVEQLLAHAEKQTNALESLRGIALVWSAFAAIGLLIWIVGLFA